MAHKGKLNLILGECANAQADILVLTETDARIQPKYRYCFHTPYLVGVREPAHYADTENRVSVFTNYRCIRQYPTYDDTTAICVELETEKGSLLVYGAIIGISGNRQKSYGEDLVKQLKDITSFARSGHRICMVGDYNCTFGDNYYYTKFGRDSMLGCFSENQMSILTADRPGCIDHIAVSDAYIGNATITINEWNYEKTLSDHKGIVVEILD